MRRKTVKSLMSDKKAVYVKLSSDKVAKVFFAQAEYEGLVLKDGVKDYATQGVRYVRLNADGSI